MSQLQEHGAYWHDDRDDGYELVYKRYEPKVDLIAAVYVRKQAYRAVILEKVPYPHPERPTWFERRPAALFSSQSEAVSTVEDLIKQEYVAAATTIDLPDEFKMRDGRGVPVRNGKHVIQGWKSMLWDFIKSTVVVFLFFGGYLLIREWMPLVDQKFPRVSEEVIAERFNHYMSFAGWVALGGGLLVTWRNLSIRRKLNSLQAADKFAAQFGLTPDDVQRIADSKRIMPQVNINGMDYYNPRDFGDMSTLLQPASAPSNDVLLQPAAATATNEEILLRSSTSSGSNPD